MEALWVEAVGIIRNMGVPIGLTRGHSPAVLFTLLYFYRFTFHRRDQPLRFPEPSLASWEPSLETQRPVFSFPATTIDVQKVSTSPQ